MEYKMCTLVLSLLIGFLQCNLARPDPLVSSSGMMALARPTEKQEIKDEQLSGQTSGDTLFSNKREASIPVPEAEPGEALHLVKKSVPPDVFTLLSPTGQPFPHSGSLSNMGASPRSMDMQADPMEWGRLPQPRATNPQVETKKNPVVWASPVDDQGLESAEASDNVVYSEQRKAVLHPYVADPNSIVTIPTLILTPSTTPTTHAQSLANALTVPQQVEGKPIIMHPGARENNSSHGSLIEGGEAPTNDSSDIVINEPKFVFVDENHLHGDDVFDDLETPTRIARKSRNDTSNNATGISTTEIPGKGNTTLNNASSTTESTNSGRMGPPWEDDEVVGKLTNNVLINPTEVSFKVASKLCKKIAKLQGPTNTGPKRYYLWAPINQYLPLLRKAFPIRPPLYAPECLKWVLRQCRGTVRLPLLKPCTYWAPMPIRRPECGFNPTLKSMIVNYRHPEHVPGNCPCVWPCTERFDPIQRCRVTINETERQLDQIHSNGDPWSDKEIIIQDNLAAQLCRGMKLALTVDHTIPVGWLPMRADVVANREDIDSDHYSSTPESTQRRRRRESGSKAKREQIYVKPEKQDSESSEETDGKEQDDRFTLMGTYNLDRLVAQNGTSNMTTIQKCNVWKYKSCPRSLEESEEWQLGGNVGRRRKRSIPQYLSRLALASNYYGEETESFMDKKRFVRQSQLDDDDVLFEKTAECGEWVRSESYRCIPEEHIQMTRKTAESSSEEGDIDEKLKLAAKNQKKRVLKDLCPGSIGKFPCFLRKKRSAEDDEGTHNRSRTHKRHEKRNAAGDDGVSHAETPLSSTLYIINKIQIRPDSSCMCEWPCLPFFDRVNKCYDGKGNVLVDELGRPKIAARSFRKSQRDPVVCINFVEVDEIYCKVKE